MGYRTKVDGAFAIVPPLEYKDLKDSRWYYRDSTEPGYHKPRINTIRETVETDSGTMTTIQGVSVSYGEGAEPFKAYSMESDIQEIVDSLPEGTRLTGYLERMGEDGQQSRIRVRDGKVEIVVPQIVWPET